MTFTSRHRDDLELWAIFERPGDPPTSPRLGLLGTHPLSPENPDLLAVFALFGLVGTPAVNRPQLARRRVVAVDVGSVRKNFAWASLDLPDRQPVGEGGRHPEAQPQPSSRRSLTACRWCWGSRRH